MNGLPETLQQVILHFSDPDNALAFAVRMRWPDGRPTCPREGCESQESTFLPSRRVWECKVCKRQYSVKAGSIFEDSHISLDKWLCAMWMIANDKNGISSYEVHRALAVTQKTAWFMMHRIRLAMQSGSLEKKLCGTVEADETFVGGRTKLMNNKSKMRKIAKGMMPTDGTVGKAIVMGLLERHGKARVKVVTGRKRHHVVKEIEKHVEPGSNLYTDSLQSYSGLTQYVHEVIDHTEAYVRDKVIHTNGLENFWSLFKRALKGTYVRVEPYHLQAYADEQCFRFNNRKVADVDRFVAVAEQIAGKRITYKELIGREVEIDPVDRLFM